MRNCFSLEQLPLIGTVFIFHFSINKPEGGFMKKLIMIMVSTLLVFSPVLAQEKMSTSIREVTVYSQGAMVKREGTSKVGKGIQELLIELQAFAIDKDSITARVFGEGEIQSVLFREIPVVDPGQTALKNAEEKLRKLKEARKQTANEKDVLDKKELFLTSLFKQPVLPPGMPDVRSSLPKVQDLDQMLTFLGGSFRAIHGLRMPLEIKLEDLNKQILVAEKELEALKAPGLKSIKVIQITFLSKKEQAVKVETSYLVPKATWQPLYKVSVPLDMKGADLLMLGDIKQNSGEEWKNVTMTISNVVQQRGSAPPDPQPWTLDISRADSAAQYRLKKSMPLAAAPKVFEALAMKAMAPEEETAQMAVAEKSELPFSFEYRLAGTLTVESGDRETLAPLFSKALEGQFYYLTVPKINPAAFLLCKMKADKELLPGPVNAYFGGRFVGKTFISEKRAGEDFQISVGQDREIRVARDKVRDKIQETSWGFDKDNIVRDMAFRLTIENLKSRPIKIKVLDTIPVPRTDRITIKNLKVKPEAAEKAYQGKEGVYVWDLELKPGDKQEITIEFQLTYPKDTPVSGL
jgi:uncharacterized protein (TIGR02231 family)